MRGPLRIAVIMTFISQWKALMWQCNEGSAKMTLLYHRPEEKTEMLNLIAGSGKKVGILMHLKKKNMY